METIRPITRYLVCQPLIGQYSARVIAVFCDRKKATTYAAGFGYMVRPDDGIGWRIGDVVSIPFCGGREHDTFCKTC